MDKNRYVEGEKFKVTQFMGSLVLGAGALVIMSLSILDYFVAPEHFSKFLVYRSATSLFEILLLFLLILNKQKKSRYIQAGIFTLGTLAVSIMVELMILHFGGHQSTYYAGMIIVFMFTIGFLPLFSIKISLFLAVSAFAIYLFPILALDNITNVGTFINNTAFLIATANIGLLWRYYNDRILT